MMSKAYFIVCLTFLFLRTRVFAEEENKTEGIIKARGLQSIIKSKFVVI